MKTYQVYVTCNDGREYPLSGGDRSQDVKVKANNPTEALVMARKQYPRIADRITSVR
jgi:hypothetical protein